MKLSTVYTPENDKYYLSIGDKAPWQNKVQIRVPRWFVRWFNNRGTR